MACPYERADLRGLCGRDVPQRTDPSGRVERPCGEATNPHDAKDGHGCRMLEISCKKQDRGRRGPFEQAPQRILFQQVTRPSADVSLARCGTGKGRAKNIHTPTWTSMEGKRLPGDIPYVGDVTPIN